MRHLLITVDVEDWFQVENFRDCIPFSSWPSCQMRVEQNTHVLLDLFDSAAEKSGQPNAPRTSRDCAGPSNSLGLHATFFVLGWIARRLPSLVREIQSRGHEVASHGENHFLHYDCSGEKLKEDLSDSKKLLEDIIGCEVHGYRAPSFSIDYDALKLIEDCGYHYDSSFNSFGGNARYGKMDLSGRERVGIAYKLADAFYELPISNIPVGRQSLPVGGGGYFRVIPAPLMRWCIRRILENERAYLFYIHPWEIDLGQPRVQGCSRLSRYRHYANLHKTLPKLSGLIDTFRDCCFNSCRQYLESLSAG